MLETIVMALKERKDSYTAADCTIVSLLQFDGVTIAAP
jgi:hypothetical protein